MGKLQGREQSREVVGGGRGSGFMLGLGCDL